MNNQERLRVTFGEVTGAHIPLAVMALASLDPDDLRRGLSTLDLAESVGPIIDPTAYMRSADARAELRRVIAALLPAVVECRAQRQREQERCVGGAS